jgi:hypothetical protein
MEDITLHLGGSITFSKENYVGNEIIPLSQIILPGSYIISGNIITQNSITYQLDFNQRITDVSEKVFGISYFVDVIDEPLDIYLNILEDIDISSFIFSVIRNS